VGVLHRQIETLGAWRVFPHESQFTIVSHFLGVVRLVGSQRRERRSGCKRRRYKIETILGLIRQPALSSAFCDVFGW
jgi:hypothetical protein